MAKVQDQVLPMNSRATQHNPDNRSRLIPDVSPRIRVLCAAAGVASVLPLLAWVYGLGSFRSWFLVTTLPGLATLVLLMVGHRSSSGVKRIITVGLFAGLFGTLAYDVFRIPFEVVWGYRLLSPIQSYGVLLTGSVTSSGWTDLAGWTWHFSNGVGFAIAYVAVAERRHWPLGVVWAMVLESAAVFTPFATAYSLRGKVDVIVIAYGAHIPFGLAIGWAGQHSHSIYERLREMTRRPNTLLVGISALVLVGWLQPAQSHRLDETPHDAIAAIEQGRLHPEFVRVGTGECLVLANFDASSYEIAHAIQPARIEGNSVSMSCFPEPGVHRLPLDARPFRGGFVIVDPFASNGHQEGT